MMANANFYFSFTSAVIKVSKAIDNDKKVKRTERQRGKRTKKTVQNILLRRKLNENEMQNYEKQMVMNKYKKQLIVC